MNPILRIVLIIVIVVVGAIIIFVGVSLLGKREANWHEASLNVTFYEEHLEMDGILSWGIYRDYKYHIKDENLYITVLFSIFRLDLWNNVGSMFNLSIPNTSEINNIYYIYKGEEKLIASRNYHPDIIQQNDDAPQPMPATAPYVKN